VNPKILFAGLFHETHSLLDDSTGLGDFTIVLGDDLLKCEGDNSAMGGALQFGREHDWDIIPALDYHAEPGGTIADEVVEQWWKDFRAHWRSDVDAIFLVLHGATVSKSFPDVEGEILKRIRNLRNALGLPIFGVCDMQANFTSAMVTHANALVTCRTIPTNDARETAERAAALLDRCLDTGEVPRTVLLQSGVNWPQTAGETTDDPMLELQNYAQQLENATGGIWAINVTTGIVSPNTSDPEISFQSVSTGHISKAERVLRDISGRALKIQENLNPSSPEEE